FVVLAQDYASSEHPRSPNMKSDMRNWGSTYRTIVSLLTGISPARLHRF
ncbi:MAG: hypothetical protein RLZZ115_3512, partial [Cyanobacteriota bacterium]